MVEMGIISMIIILLFPPPFLFLSQMALLSGGNWRVHSAGAYASSDQNTAVI